MFWTYYIFKMTKEQRALNRIASQIAKCKICQQGKVGLPVPGEGNPNADIVFIGEAPGKKEAATGRPFIGRAGVLLRSLLASMGLKDQDVFITSPVKYLPRYVTPTLADIAHGRTHLNAQLDVIKPKVIVLMGNVATQAVLEEKFSIAKKHGKVIRRDNRAYFLSYHPAAALYLPRLRPVIKKDFHKLKRLIGK